MVYVAATVVPATLPPFIVNATGDEHKSFAGGGLGISNVPDVNGVILNY